MESSTAAGLKDFLSRRAVTPILALLREGITPEKIALSVALGAAIGVFPVLGSTTLLCALAAWLLRLNQPAIQLVNYFIYPLQLALIVPMMQVGGRLSGSSHASLSLSPMTEMFRVDALAAAAALGTAVLGAILLWLAASPIVVAAIYYSLVPLLRRARFASDAP